MKPTSQKAIDRLFEKFKNDVPEQPHHSENAQKLDVAKYLGNYGIEVTRQKTHGSSKLYCLGTACLIPTTLQMKLR